MESSTPYLNLLRPRLTHLIASSILILAILSLVTFHRPAQDYYSSLSPPHTTNINTNTTHPAKIGKVSMLVNSAATNPTYQRALKTHTRHASQHSYPTFLLHHDINTGYWNKIYYLLQILLSELAKPESQRLTFLFWHDADTILLNPSFALESFLPPPHMDKIDLILSKDLNGLNNGLFLVRVSRDMAEYTGRVAAYHYFNPEVDLPWPEQVAMQLVLNQTDDYHDRVVYMPQHLFNAYTADVEPGHLLVHFAGVADRDEKMEGWMDRMEGGEWDVPVTGARMAEIDHLWDVVGSFRRVAGAFNGEFYVRYYNMSANMPGRCMGLLNG
ncbi:hypothetical protein PMZ80_000802 [Knufia obscura]|uniref:Uncharacterized protein n=1 Tax=Knufia obscura TaxID=1635080 RepID=A0ABR0S2R6_9EURO|nr:hypothetical protein PMZ80_000802 [Knufia obscura]